MSRGAAVDIVRITLLTVRQRSNGECRAPLRGIFGANEFGELLIRGDHVGIDGFGDYAGQASLILSGNALRIFLGGLQKRIGLDNAFTLSWYLLGEETHRHQLVF